jgi:hypothetical protein
MDLISAKKASCSSILGNFTVPRRWNWEDHELDQQLWSNGNVGCTAGGDLVASHFGKTIAIGLPRRLHALDLESGPGVSVFVSCSDRQQSSEMPYNQEDCTAHDTVFVCMQVT